MTSYFHSSYILYCLHGCLVKVCCSVIFITALSGCTTMQIDDYSVNASTTYKQSQEIQNINASIKPITKPDELIKFFGENLLNKNIIPIHIIIRNKSKSTSFLVNTNKITLHNQSEAKRNLNNENAHKTEINLNKTHSNAQKAVLGGLTILPLGVVLVAAPVALVTSYMEGNIKEIRRNLEKKRLRNKTISPGAMVSGFVYFNIPPNKINTDLWDMRLEITGFEGQNRTFIFKVKTGNIK